jgi:hypothetical protein
LGILQDMFQQVQGNTPPFPAGHDEKAYISQVVAAVITQAKACGYRLLLASFSKRLLGTSS